MSLSKELKQQIEREAIDGTNPNPKADNYSKGWNAGYMVGYKQSGGTYAEKWQAAEQWKAEATTLLDPLLKWGHAQKDIPLGSSITEELLRRAKLWQAAEQERIAAKKLLDEVFRKHEAGLLPDRFVYEKIKDFLYPTPKPTTDE